MSAPSSPRRDSGGGGGDTRSRLHQRQLSYPLSKEEGDELVSESDIVMLPSPPTPAKKKNSFYEVQVANLLGEGTQGAVYPARENPFAGSSGGGGGHWDKAIKIMDMSERISTRIAYHTECRILRKIQKSIQHPNIVQYFNRGMLSRSTGVIVLERLPATTLAAFVVDEGVLSAMDALRVMDQLADAVYFLHTYQVSPRDIKPDNISIDPSTLHVKLFDFGLAIDTSECDRRYSSQQTGTWVFMAPEVLHGKVHDTFKADMWCLGQVLYFMLAGHSMFGSCVDMRELKAINSPDQKTLSSLSKDDFFFDSAAYGQCYDILLGLCDPWPSTRWKAKKLVRYLTQAKKDNSPRDKN